MLDAPATSGSHRLAPYPGLRAFRQDEASIFFGRDEQIDGLLERLECERLVVIAGESGCGKSSLVRAGLLPALEAGFLHDGCVRWSVADLRPGNQPIHNLAVALASVLPPSPAKNVELLAARLRYGPRSIADILKDFPAPSGTEFLILVDQFEELIRFRARIDPNEADAFVALLLETVADESLHIRVVLTLRTDYLGGCAIFPGLPEALNGSQYLVPRLGREQLRETIINPARFLDGDVDSALANQLINEVGQSQDQLPVLEHALLWMWRQPRTRPPASLVDGKPDGEVPAICLTIDDYRALGGLGEALSRHADKVYEALGTDEKKRIASRLFCSLWDEGASGNDTRRPCTVREAAESAGVTTDELKVVAEAFRNAEHSFLMPPPDVALMDDTVLDIGHESLFRHWVRLKNWIRKEADDAEHYRRLHGQALDRKLRDGDLLSGRALELGVEWRDSVQPNAAWANRYSANPDDFADVQRFLRDSELGRRIRTWIKSSFAIMITVAVWGVLFWIAQYHEQRDQENRRAEFLRQQTYSAASFGAHSEPVRALQLALEAQGEDKNPQAGAALHSGLRASHFRSMVFPSLGGFDDARFLDDGRIVTVGEADGLAVWEVRTGRRLYALYSTIPRRLAVHVSEATSLAATASADGTVDLWDLSTRKLLWNQRHQVSPIADIAFSPDGLWLATASEDGTTVLWDVTNGKARHLLVDHLGAVTGLAFSHDSRRMATVGADDRIVLWDTQSGKKLELFARLPNATHVAFDAAGGFLAAISGNGVTLWDPITQHQEGSLLHSNRVTAVAFSPDGRRIATTGLDGTLHVWDSSNRTERFWTSADVPLHDDGRPSGELASSHDGEASWLLTVAFSANGRKIVTTGRDGSAKIWDVEAGGELRTFRAHEQAIRRVAYNPTGAYIATASDDGAAAIWDREGLPVLQTRGPDVVRAMGFNAAGTELAVSSGSKVVVWNIAKRAAIDPPLRNDSEVEDLQFFHAKDRLAIATDSHIAVWGISERRPFFTIDANVTLKAVAVSPDDQLIASECRGNGQNKDGRRQICLWDARTGSKIATLGSPARTSPVADKLHDESLDAHRLPILSLCFSPDGAWLASSSEDKTVKIWNMQTRTYKATLRGHRESIAGLAISPDSTMLVSIGDDWVRLWNASSYVTKEGFPDGEYASDSVAFSPDGKSFVAGGHDGVVRVYATDSDSLRRVARDRTPIHLTESECKRYTDQDCHETRTALQLANEGRHLLHSGPNAIGEIYLAMAAMTTHDDQSTFGQERDRFASARKIHEAYEGIAAPLRKAAVDFTNTSNTSEDGSEHLVDLLTATRSPGRRRAEATLQQLRSLDANLVLDPTGLASRIDALVLTEQGVAFAIAGRLSWAEHTFMLTTIAVDELSWAAHAVTSVASAEAVRRVREHLLYRDATAARNGLINIVPTMARENRNPQLLVLLRFIATTWEAVGMPNTAVALVEHLYPKIDDAEVLVDFADFFIRTGRSKTALAVLGRALFFDPTNDQALWLLGRAQYDSDQFRQAAATLRTVSPLAPVYKKAAALAAMITYEKLDRPREGYRWMVVAVDSHNAASWANLAEAAWATNRLREARLIASRVLDARAVQPASPDIELAMRFVLVAALCQDREYGVAENELDALVERAPSVDIETWSYEGSRTVVSGIKDARVRKFAQALLSYSESRGKAGDPQELHRLLHEARDAQTH